MLFGEFLFLKCLVDEETLLRALGQQVRSRPLLGEVAVQEGYMSAWDVYRVVNEQAKVHRYFGDIALELGLISQDELDHLLTLQAEGTTALGEILVNDGVFDRAQLDTLLEEFFLLKAKYEASEGASDLRDSA